MGSELATTKASETRLFSKAISHLSYLVRMLRVQDWSYLLGIPLLAALHSADSLRGDSGFAIAAVFGFSAVYFSWGYVFNNLFDQGEDSAARNSFKAVRWRWAATLTLVLHALFIAVSIANGLFLAAMFVSVCNAVYSVQPFRLKRFLFPSLLANGIFFSFPYYASIRILKGTLGLEDARFCFLVFLLFLPLQYVHFLEHEEAAGNQTTLFRKMGSVVLFGALCAGAALADTGHRWGLPGATAVYSAICVFALFRLESAERARVAIRFVSMGFGLYLAASSPGSFL